MSEGIPAEAEDRLTSEPLAAYLATSHDDRPHVAPVWYDYREGTVELTTTGRKLANVRANPRVSMAVQKEAAGHPEWLVTLQGTATVVEDEAANREATRRINERYGADPEDWAENTLVRVAVGSATLRTY